MATGLVRPVRNLRTSRFHARHQESTEDVVIKLDLSKEPKENIQEILKNCIIQNGVPSSRKTAYLNSFVKIIKIVGHNGNLGMAIPEIMACLEIGLLNDNKQVRTATLRVIRYLLTFEDALSSFLQLHLDYLVARSLDVSLDNEIERIHAIKLMRQIIKFAPDRYPKSLVFPLVALGNDGASERDRMVRVSLETLCEFAFYNVDLLSKCGGLQCLIWNILDCHQYPRLNEALTSTVLYLLNHPKTRHYIKPQVDLERLLAPFTDSHFRSNIDDGRGEEKETKFIASKMAVITVMRSWPGLMRLCHPEGAGMQSLIGILYLPYTEIRRYILELISDLFRLNLPDWSDQFAVSFSSIDPSGMKDAWKLTEGFVAEEGRAILGHISRTRPNLIDNHLALLLSAWITAGLLEALVEVAISSEGALVNRAILLLGELLHMACTLLPPECTHHSECLPTLISMASSCGVSSEKRRRAHKAVMYLTRFHAMKKRGPKPCSLFLDQLLQHAGKMSEVTSRHWHLRREKLSEYYFKKVMIEDQTSQAIKDSQVLNSKNTSHWDWALIAGLLKWPDEKLKKLEDQFFFKYIRCLVNFFKPDNDLFSNLDLSEPNARHMCIVGCYLIDFLLSCNQEEADKMINEWLIDVMENLREITKLNVPVDENAMFGAKRLYEKLCRFYFLFIGRFSATKNGCLYLEKTGVIQILLEMMCPASSVMHVKLALSALNFSLDGSTRAVLSKALTSTADICRLYATKLLRVLMRCGTQGFSSWGIELLVTQLYDQEKGVAMSAINILDEACDNEENIQSIIKLRPSLLHLGDKGVMLLSRLVSSVRGFRALNDSNFIASQLEKWEKHFNEHYVEIVEEMLNEALTTYEKTFSGSCPRRSILMGPKKEVFLPAHLYGQLTMHDEGLELLYKEKCILEYFAIIQDQVLLTCKNIHTLKTALWAVGHLGLSVGGLSWLESHNIIPELIRLAEECSVFSIRGTAFFVLCLISNTRKGADLLCTLGWESRCHSRQEPWPVLDQDGWIHGPMSEALRLSDHNASRALMETARLSIGATGLALIQEEFGNRLIHNQSRPFSEMNSTDSLQSAGKHFTDHSPQSNASLSPSKASLSGVMRSKTLPHESSYFKRFQSLPSRSKSEKVENEDISNLVKDDSVANEPEYVASAEHVKIELRSPKNGGENDSSTKEEKNSRDSYQLIASPVVKLRTNSDEDSAIASDNNCDNPSEGSSSCGSGEAKTNPVDIDSVKQSSPTDAGGDGDSGDEDGGVGKDDGKSGGDNDVVHNIPDSVSKIQSCVHSKDSDKTSNSVSEINSPEQDAAASLKSANSSNTLISQGSGDSSEVVSFKIGNSSIFNKVSSSSDSSNRSKSRGNSFNTTDSSGVGSGDSGPQLVTAITPSILTPIPSSSSLTAVSSSSNLLTGAEQAREVVHPSAISRSLFRLSRVPSAKKASTLPVNSQTTFTSYRDAVGYAALRSIKRNRTHSTEGDNDSTSCLELPPSVRRSISHESEISTDNSLWLSMRRNVSSTSLQDQESVSSPVTANLNKSLFKPLSPSNRFVGLTLPVDIKMIFEVVEGEDKRTSQGNSLVQMQEKSQVPPLKKETSFEHTQDCCLMCNAFLHETLPNASKKECAEFHPTVDAAVTKLSNDASASIRPNADITRVSGGSGHKSSTPDSHSSPQDSHDTGTQKLTEDSPEGRDLIRLEVMRLIVNLSSSVGLKGSETGLLNLKQRFPKCFQNLCFYSEVCHLLSSYSYRLLARRFIHELFDELDFRSLLEGPSKLLDVDMESPGPMETIRQDSLDEFHDFSFS